ncbi:protein FAM166B isoform X2 [Daktulosphaira vitifoliae]|uniref:protein FAM166B isoform X2 n=1 Tax=Daktulosphaira vitifoliae TaxID=58002 RepID=UPI0021AA32E5|nr:protein FAM166B isoform X2 [Daktulosphaira vitifoliae]
MVSFRDILPPQPHYLSGYSGFVPGYKFQHGRSFGSLTHDLFLNPSVKRSSMSVLTDLKTEHNSRPNIYELATIANRCDYRECKYNVDLKPGYDGHVPNKKEFFGKGYSVESAMGLSMFEKTKRHCSCLECKERKIQPIETKESFENINNYSFPLTKVPGGEKKFIEENRQHLPMPPSGSPYFIDNASVHKTFMSGYSGHVPRLPIYHGLSYSIAVKKALCEFTTRYNRLMREKLTIQTKI